MQIELMDDICYVEVGRVQNDGNYGNWRLSVKVPCKAKDIEKTEQVLISHIQDKLDEWITAEREKKIARRAF